MNARAGWARVRCAPWAPCMGGDNVPPGGGEPPTSGPPLLCDCDGAQGRRRPHPVPRGAGGASAGTCPQRLVQPRQDRPRIRSRGVEIELGDIAAVMVDRTRGRARSVQLATDGDPGVVIEPSNEHAQHPAGPRLRGRLPGRAVRHVQERAARGGTVRRLRGGLRALRRRMRAA